VSHALITAKVEVAVDYDRIPADPHSGTGEIALIRSVWLGDIRIDGRLTEEELADIATGCLEADPGEPEYWP
jgi:hypothetical protein